MNRVWIVLLDGGVEGVGATYDAGMAIAWDAALEMDTDRSHWEVAVTMLRDGARAANLRHRTGDVVSVWPCNVRA